ncbi:MAG: 6,7-dimethyl-8-ribityllumazine synthase [Myxococcales bacterium]|nr:6,7-dimethyl-8-ribityllumazine synthase [Myxococcales bacterium]
MKSHEGNYQAAAGARFALVASRFNHFIVDRLVEGAADCFARHGLAEDALTVVRVPGAWEIPLICDRLARSGKFAGIVAVSAVIRGSTPHFEYVAAETAKGTAQAMLKHGVPISFGVLTTDTIEQAIERAGTKAGNKGWDAALGILEMASLDAVLKANGI